MKNHQGKLALVTGGSEGIGKEVAKEFVRSGANVIVLSRSAQKLATALSELKALQSAANQIISTETLDVTNAEETERTLNQLISKHGTPDFVINCAGYARPGYIQDLSLDHFRKMMELNYFGIVNVCKTVVPALVKARRGTIVNTSSMAGFIGLFGYTGYCASKYAVVGFSEALRRELEPYGVRVSVLCPPNTRTPGLEEENKYKPAEVLKTEEKAKPVDPDYVARELLKKLPKNEFIIVPTFDGKLAYSLSRFAPSILHRFVKRPKEAAAIAVH